MQKTSYNQDKKKPIISVVDKLLNNPIFQSLTVAFIVAAFGVFGQALVLQTEQKHLMEEMKNLNSKLKNFNANIHNLNHHEHDIKGRVTYPSYRPLNWSHERMN